MDVIKVAVMAPMFGPDLSYVTDVDPRVQTVDVDDPAALAEADVLLIGYPVPKDVASRIPRLQWAHHTQAGVSNLLGSDLWSCAATLTSTRGSVSATAIAEYVLAAAGYFARGLHEATRQKAAGEFSRDHYEMLTLRGATMGIIGLGGIGQEVARLSRAAGMRVVGTRRSITEPQTDVDGADLALPADRILDVAAEADFLAICSQLTPETRGMVDADVFAAMRPSAVLINIARGEEVDEDALIAAITGGQIRGAVLDVFVDEFVKPPRRELVELPQILITPHLSGLGDTTMYEPMREVFVENLRRFVDGRPLLNEVDRERGY
jgi:phosphoglycerate dehydrogenase-like enzyme